jgi:hypothetical protein
VQLSLGKSIRDNAPRQLQVADLDELYALLDKHRAAKKSSAGYICGGFSNGARSAESVLPTRLLVLDADKLTPDQQPQWRLHNARWRGLGWPTHSSTAEAPRERAIIVLSRPVSREESMALGRRLARDYAEALGVELDPATFKPEQPVYLVPAGVTIARYDGEALDVDAHLDAGPGAAGAPAGAVVSDQDLHAGLRHGEQIHDTLVSLAARYIGRGMPAADARAALEGLMDQHRPAAGDPQFARWKARRGEVARIVASAVRKFTRPALSPAGDAPPEAATLETTRAADVRMEPINWLWPDRIARGKLTLVAGEPGLGKTQMLMSLAAIVTSGGTWPASTDRAHPGSALIMSAEDDPADTLVPRLAAAGADLQRVHMATMVRDTDRAGKARRRAANLAEDLALIEAKLAELGDVALVIIDPVSAYLGRTDSHNNSEVRAILAPVSDMAGRHGAAVVAISHLNKSNGQKAMQRVAGSIAFTAAARGAYLVAAESEGSARRVLVPLKHNIGTDKGAFTFTIESAEPQPGIKTSRVRWDDSIIDVTANQLLADHNAAEPDSATDRAEAFIKTALAGGPVAATVMEQEAQRAGVSWAAVRRAAPVLGVVKQKEKGQGPRARWMWSWPQLQDAQHAQDDQDAQDAQDAHE